MFPGKVVFMSRETSFSEDPACRFAPATVDRIWSTIIKGFIWFLTSSFLDCGVHCKKWQDTDSK